jgi:hypothetical protein
MRFGNEDHRGSHQPKVVDRIVRHLDKNAVTPRSPSPISAQLNATLLSSALQLAAAILRTTAED